jgi:multidrug efflux pump subunit AcrA (membrane-fusion protein)
MFDRCLPGLVLLGALIIVGCEKAATPPQGHVSAGPVAVSVVHPERKSIGRVVEQPGTIQAFEETLLYARVPGYVRRLRSEVDIGYLIRGPKYDESGKETEPGEVLAELVVPELEEESKQKQAMVRQVEAEVVQAIKAREAADANVIVAEAAVAEAQANFDRWESEAKRFATLAKDRVIDSQSRDEVQNQVKAAAGRLTSARAMINKSKADRQRSDADVAAAESRVNVVKADALRSQAMLGYASIRAPFDGVVTARKVNTGTFVQPMGGSGDWLFRVARRDPVRAVVAVPEADAELVKEHLEVKLNVQALPGAMLTGKIARTSWALEAGPRTLRAEIDVPNKDDRLRPGMYVYAKISTQLPETWVLPASAVVKQGDLMVCFFVEGDKAVRVPVQVGRTDGQFIQVLRRQKGGASAAWEEFSRADAVAGKAAGLSDGQPIQVESGH